MLARVAADQPIDAHQHACPAGAILEHRGKNGRVAISHDSRIRYVPNELAAVVQFKVALLIVIGRVPIARLAGGFVTSMKAIEAFLTLHSPPYIAKVYRPTLDGTVGRIEL